MPSVPQVAYDYLRTAINATMRGSVQVIRPNVPVYDSSTGYAVGSTKEFGYNGPANVHNAMGAGEQEFADGMVEVNTVQVTIPYDATPIPSLEDHVLVSVSSDPAMVGETLRIIGISSGGTFPVVRTLTCTFVQSNPFNPTA